MQSKRVHPYKKIKTELLRDLVRPLLQSGGPLPPKKELAARYQVNVGTLDKALQELEAEGLVEKRMGAGTYVLAQSNAGGEIGIYYDERLLCATREGLFGDMLDLLLQEEIIRAGRTCRHYCDRRPDSRKGTPLPQLAEDISNKRLSALLIIRARRPLTAWLDLLPVPILGFGHDYGWGCVAADLRQGGEMAAQALIKKNCASVELLSTVVHEWQSPQTSDLINRPLRAGMANALRAEGLPAPECWLTCEMLPESMRNEWHGQPPEISGYELCKILLRQKRPQGLVIYTDVLAIGVARALTELGLKAGRDIQVAVVGNAELDMPGTEDFLRVDISIHAIAARLWGLTQAAERGDAPREEVVLFREREGKDEQT